MMVSVAPVEHSYPTAVITTCTQLNKLGDWSQAKSMLVLSQVY